MTERSELGSARKQFGEHLEAAMSEGGVSVTALSRATGISRDTIVNYKRGRSCPDGESFVKVVQALGADETQAETFLSLWDSARSNRNLTGEPIKIDPNVRMAMVDDNVLEMARVGEEFWKKRLLQEIKSS